MTFEKFGTSPTIKIGNTIGESLKIRLQHDVLVVDRSESGITSFHKSFPTMHFTPIRLSDVEKLTVYVDATSVEIFVNDSEQAITEIVFPNEPYRRLEVSDILEVKYSGLDQERNE